MIKTAKKDNSARVCYTFDNNLEKISIKERKPEGGERSVKVLNQIHNLELIVKQDNLLLIDRDVRMLYKTHKGEFKDLMNIFKKEYWGCVQTPESSDVACFYGDDGTGKDSVIAVRMISVKVI